VQADPFSLAQMRGRSAMGLPTCQKVQPSDLFTAPMAANIHLRSSQTKLREKYLKDNNTTSSFDLVA